MIVIEASALVDTLVDDPANRDLLAVLAEEALHAPALLDFEVASALRGHVLGGLLDEDRLDSAVRSFTALRIERHPMTGMLGDILALRANFTAYDAAYIVLGQALAAPIVTCDVKLIEARRLGLEVRLFGSAG